MTSENTNKFIVKSKRIHGENTFDYGQTEYVVTTKVVWLKCNECNLAFKVRPDKHLSLDRKKGCPACKKLRPNPRSLTTEEFVKRAIAIYGPNRYRYSNPYIGTHVRIEIECVKHHTLFIQTPFNHLQNHEGCKKCCKEATFERNRLKPLEKAKSAAPEIILEEILTMNCGEHGPFDSTIKKLKKFSIACPACRKIVNRKKQMEENGQKFIIAAMEKFGDRYDYSKAIYTYCNAPVCIICPEHGEFFHTPKYHLQGNPCSKCSAEERRLIPYIKKLRGSRKSTSVFIQQSIEKHGNIYDYSKTLYIGSKMNVCIICPEHGEFFQKPNSHLSGRGCNECGIARRAITQTKTLNEFVEEASKVHDGKYSYAKTEYIIGAEKVCIICPKHGEFWQKPVVHVQGFGCKGCNETRGENAIRKYLKNSGIIFEPQQRFAECKHINTLPFDFAVFDKNKNLVALIEFQGRQHYCSIEIFGGDVNLEVVQRNDAIKRKYCLDNNIPLLAIPYTELKKVPVMLSEFFNGI
jgi:hypothetical protein